MSDLTGSPANPSDDAGFRDLALRLLMLRGATGIPGQSVPTLLPGRLPPDLALELPALGGVRLIGSLVEGPMAIVVYDTPQPMEDAGVAAFDALTAAGWREDEPWWHANRFGGFSDEDGSADDAGMPTGRGRARMGHVRLARGQDEPTLLLMTAPAPEAGHSTLALHVNGDPSSPARANLGQARLEPILPQLTPPPGIGQLAHGGGDGESRVESNGTVEGPTLSLPAVAAHYGAQLVRAGWQLDASQSLEQAAWSQWSFARGGQPWRGVLVLMKITDTPQPRAMATLHTEYIGDPRHRQSGRRRLPFGAG